MPYLKHVTKLFCEILALAASTAGYHFFQSASFEAPAIDRIEAICHAIDTQLLSS